MIYELDAEAWDTEERILDSLRGYTVELTFALNPNGVNPRPPEVVLYTGWFASSEGKTVLEVRAVNDEGEITGPVTGVLYERVEKMKVL